MIRNQVNVQQGQACAFGSQSFQGSHQMLHSRLQLGGIPTKFSRKVRMLKIGFPLLAPGMQP